MKLCFATGNQNKLQEVERILRQDLLSLEEIGCHEDIPETQDTIQGNAIQKSRYVFENYKVGCFADDTGLEVEALDGAPGIYSARYAGPRKSAEDNMALLLQNLKGKRHRSARFVTVIAYIDPAGNLHTFEGIVNGKILSAPRGKKGFGYDPVFVPEGYNVTFAEMPLSEKNKISHRARAIHKFRDFLQQ